MSWFILIEKQKTANFIKTDKFFETLITLAFVLEIWLYKFLMETSSIWKVQKSLGDNK